MANGDVFTDPDLERRRQLALSLINRQGVRPESLGSLAANLGASFLAKRNLSRVEREQQEKNQRLIEALNNAGLFGGQQPPAQGIPDQASAVPDSAPGQLPGTGAATPGFNPLAGAMSGVQGPQPVNTQSISDIAAINPRLALQLGLSQRQQAQGERDFSREAALKLQIAGINNQSGAFGNSLQGAANNILLQAQRLTDAGMPIPQDLQRQVEAAKQVLTSERFMIGPSGERTVFTPGLPGFARETSAPSGQSPTGIQTPSGGRVDILQEKPGLSKDEVNRIDGSLNQVNEIAAILNEAKRKNETITGVIGTTKRFGGGLARQAGVPVSPLAERLQRRLSTLQGQVGPLLLNEKRLSETERERLKEIVGEVNAATDDLILREGLVDLVNFLNDLKTRGKR